MPWIAVGQAEIALLRIGIRFLVRVVCRVHIEVRFVRAHLCAPALHIFGWLQIPKEKAS